MTDQVKQICRVASRASLTLCVFIGACSARMGDAEVREVEGLPCFAPAANEIERPGANSIVGISVSDLSRIPVEEVWTLQLYGSSAPIRLEAGACIPYGATVAEAVGSEPEVLAKNTVYEVYLSSELTDPNDSTQGFSAKFCLRTESTDIDYTLVQIMPGSNAWQSETCAEN